MASCHQVFRSVFKPKQSGYTSPRFFPRSFRGGGGEDWWFTPVPGPFRLGGYPSPGQEKYPSPGKDGVPPARSRWGTRPGQDGVPPSQDWGTPPPGQNIRARTCYAAGGMPLAFMQEDCLVFNMNIEDFLYPTRWCCGRLAKTDIPITTGGCGR